MGSHQRVRVGERLAAATQDATWVSEREIALDDFWRHEVRYTDTRGTARVTHRPDLGVHIAAGPVAIEVELQRKSAARLRGICETYALLTGVEGPLAGVIYVTDRADITAAVKRIAGEVRLADPQLSFRTLDDVVAQTHAAADAHARRDAQRAGVAR